MLTKNQFKNKNPHLTPAERGAAWKVYLAENGVSFGKLSGEDLEAARAITAKSIADEKARREKQARRESRFDENVEEIDRILKEAGFVLNNVSVCGSRYYQRGDQHVRVSDHSPNEATSAWMDKVGCDTVTTAAAALAIISEQ